MATDLNKNIVIQITAQTDQLEKSIDDLNKNIDNLVEKQKQLKDAGKETSDAFKENADKIDDYQKKLKDASTQLGTFQKALDAAANSLKTNQTLIAALTAAKDKYSKATGDNAKKVNELNAAIKTLSSTVQQHQKQTAQGQATLDAHSQSLSKTVTEAGNLEDSLESVNDTLKHQKDNVNDNKDAFDAHKMVMEHLKKSFEEVKDVSGEFGPTLQFAAQGFNAMKTGLAVVKDGLAGVGDAMKADGFDFLLQILQLIFDAFIKSATGSKMLQGALAAIGLVVNKVKENLVLFADGFIKAVSHPIDSIKKLGTMIEQNIINRFKAFSVILDGIVHLDFKKMADGALQAITGVTNATGKIAITIKAVTDVVAKTGTDIGKAYEDGVDKANKALEKLTQKGNGISAPKAGRFKHSNRDQRHNKTTLNTGDPPKQPDKFPLTKPDADDLPPDLGEANTEYMEQQAEKKQELAKQTTQKIITDSNQQRLDNQKKEDADRKARSQKIEAEAKQAAQQIAANALNALQNSIQQQSAAKLSALEKDKQGELSNTSLTSAQKLAIQAKFKKQEDKVKAKAFKEEQELSIAKTLMSAAQAAVALWADPGFPEAIAATVILGAETAAQIAQIASQKPPAYASGGLHYTSDGKGGMLPGYSRADNTNAWLRSGEGIVVSEAMRDPWARNLVSAINVGFGGRDFSTTATGRGFAVGGIFTDGGDANRYYNQPVNDQKNLANTIAYQMVNNFPPVYVDVKDVNNQQNILAQTINRVNL